METESRPLVVGPREGRFIDLGEFGMTVKASADETSGVVSVLEADEPPGFGPPIHVHHDAADRGQSPGHVRSSRRGTDVSPSAAAGDGAAHVAETPTATPEGCRS